MSHASGNPIQTRVERFETLGSRVFDLLVIGGGITGCGIARDAALRGLSVALVEREDFASGTSSRSSRLVHGGVRYLEHGHLHLVFESSAERRRLLQLAPHLVRPLEFTWPVYAGARIPRWKLNAGLTLYDALALFRNVGSHHRLTRDGVLAHEPMLRTDGLLGGASYFDAATNDARLTLANAVGAAEHAAVVVNHAPVSSLRIEGGRVVGADITDAIVGGMCAVRARAVVNATGPWSDDIRRMDGEAGAAVRGSKGVHIAIPRDRIGNRGALTLLSNHDGRVLFVLPAESDAIVGTTDTYTASTPSVVHAKREDVQYLLDAANAFFPEAGLTERDVISAWAGIRPLLPEPGTTPGSVSREHEIRTSERGLISITGGKLTTYRLMAAQVVDVVEKQLGRSGAREPRSPLPLPGGDIESLEATIAIAERTIGDARLATHLARAYGSRWIDVWNEIAATDGSARMIDGLPYTAGELRHAVRREMACTLGDIMIRRTHLAFETRDHGLAIAPATAAAVGPILGWNATDRDQAVDAYAADLDRMFRIDG
jgi:glycerol-3-phosphate dehydrogenase